MTAKILSLLGLCRRAGGVVPGAGATLECLKSGKAKALFISSDSSDRTKKQARDKASFAGVQLFELEATSDEIGHAIGLTSPCAVLALTGKGPCIAAIEAAKANR